MLKDGLKYLRKSKIKNRIICKLSVINKLRTANTKK